MNVYVVSLRSEAGRELRMCKVGIANDIERRLADIRTSSPFPADLAHLFKFRERRIAYSIERRTHELLADCRMNGEWFRCEPSRAAGTIEAAAHELHYTIIARNGVRVGRVKRPGDPLFTREQIMAMRQSMGEALNATSMQHGGLKPAETLGMETTLTPPA
ncbi:GIY-YIG nuclease family protein [Arenibaculum sp.]|jgi:hypothetical protein|uniref:GIY-YIG nuclease family protein n=1 Tax=Arenibaculum sp. TaxID=2865862 RepID=UPI002E0DA3BB|nr:GIY-YIG nuclease family protein [Arenibaculum sp.]